MLGSTGRTLEVFRSTLVGPPSNSAKGKLNTDKLCFTIAANDQITTAEQFSDVILAYRNGAPIRVRDVGQAVDAPVDRNVAAYQNNNRGIILAVVKQHGAQLIDNVDQDDYAIAQLTASV